MDSTFVEKIIEKKHLSDTFEKLSYRVLSTNYSVKDLYEVGERDVKKFVKNGYFKDSLSSGMKLLEIGCGVGRLSRSFSDSFSEVHAVDIDPDMINLSQALHQDRKNLHFHKVDGSSLTSFENNHFDFIFSYYVFQHIRNMDYIIRYFNEIKRLLKPGGMFQIQVRGKLPGGHKNVVPIRLYNLALKIECDRVFDRLRGKKWHQNRGCRFSASMLKDLVTSAKLKVLDIQYTSDTDLWVYGKQQ